MGEVQDKDELPFVKVPIYGAIDKIKKKLQVESSCGTVGILSCEEMCF